MISVCMATYNGERYIREQIDSILCQLSEEDELVISDDGSTDSTIEIIQSYQDKRVKLYVNNVRHGVTHNFENSLCHSKGDIIFLSDQDDVWLDGRVQTMKEVLTEQVVLVSCDCSLTDVGLNILRRNFFGSESPIKRSAVGNFIKNRWLGSCMAFTRPFLEKALPFPRSKYVPHDLWLGLYAQLGYKCGYIHEPLHLYRRHDSTVSFTGFKSKNSLMYKLYYRMVVAYYLLLKLIKSGRFFV